MSRKLEEMKSYQNSHILDVINSAIEEKLIPSIKKAMWSQNSAKNTNLDFRANGLHPEKVSQVAQVAQKDFPRLVAMSCNQIKHRRENSVDSNQSDDDFCDMVTGANLIPQMVPEFLTGQTCIPEPTLSTNNVSMMTRLIQPFLHSKYQPIPTLRTKTIPLTACRRNHGHEQQTISTNTDVTTSQYDHTDLWWQIWKVQIVRRSFSHDDKDAAGHDGNNENYLFSFLTAQKRATDLP